MNSTLKTVLLTLLTLSVLTIALIEVSGISQKAFFNKFETEEEKKKSQYATESKVVRKKKMEKMDKTKMLVRDSVHNFGEMVDGDRVRHMYVVENIGEEPLYIANVQVSCGCTVPKFSEDPIPPGSQGTVILEFNSKGKRGKVKKKALIQANATNAPYPIAFEAEVMAK